MLTRIRIGIDRYIGILVIALLASPTIAELPCSRPQAFEDAVSNSQAVFLGRAVDERITPMVAKGGTPIGYVEFRFEVLQSWKLIDRKFVWVRVPARGAAGCGIERVGEEYLVYANRLNDLLYVSPQSRTMAREDAGADLAKLGGKQIILGEGEFHMFSTTVTVIIFLSIALLFLATLVFIVSRRRIAVALFSFFLLVGILLAVAACMPSWGEGAQLRFALACARGDVELVKELLGANRIDVNNRNGMIGPCQVTAAYGGHDEIIKLTLERGADVNVKDENGATPLITAVLGNHRRTVELLLQNGAEPKGVMPNDKGELTGITALTIARMKGNPEMIRLVESAYQAK